MTHYPHPDPEGPRRRSTEEFWLEWCFIFAILWVLDPSRVFPIWKCVVLLGFWVDLARVEYPEAKDTKTLLLWMTEDIYVAVWYRLRQLQRWLKRGP